MCPFLVITDECLICSSGSVGGGGRGFRSLCSLAHLACRKTVLYYVRATCRCCWVRKKAENNRVAILLMANKDGKSDPLTPKRCAAPENSRRPPLRFCQRARKKKPKIFAISSPQWMDGWPFWAVGHIPSASSLAAD